MLTDKTEERKKEMSQGKLIYYITINCAIALYQSAFVRFG